MPDDELSPEDEAFLDEEIAHVSAILDAENAARERQLEAEVFGPDPALRTFLGDAEPKAIEDWGEGPKEGEVEFVEAPERARATQDQVDQHEDRLLMLENPDPEPELLPDVRWKTFVVLIWRDGGTTDGDKTHQCNRTYTAKTLDAANTLGTALTPDKRRPGIGRMHTPPTDGAGMAGLGYYDAAGDFCLYAANECVYGEACP